MLKSKIHRATRHRGRSQLHRVDRHRPRPAGIGGHPRARAGHRPRRRQRGPVRRSHRRRTGRDLSERCRGPAGPRGRHRHPPDLRRVTRSTSSPVTGRRSSTSTKRTSRSPSAECTSPRARRLPCVPHLGRRPEGRRGKGEVAIGEIRYGARPAEQVSNREVEATRSPIWSTAVTVVFETDPDAIAQVLPRPLEPSGHRPAAHRRGRHGDRAALLRGRLVRGAGPARRRRGRVRAVHAHDHRAGHDRRARDLGEPKKIAQLAPHHRRRHADCPGGPDGVGRRRGVGHARARAARLRDRQTRLLLQAASRPVGRRDRGRPALVYCRRHETARVVRPVIGECKLLDAPLDPIADFPMGESCPSSTPRSRRRSGARSSNGCRPSGWCPSCTSAMTT